MNTDLSDSPFVCYPGHPNLLQLSTLDGMRDARVTGWHYPSDGPMVVRRDGRWQAIKPDGSVRTLVRVVK